MGLISQSCRAIRSFHSKLRPFLTKNETSFFDFPMTGTSLGVREMPFEANGGCYASNMVAGGLKSAKSPPTEKVVSLSIRATRSKVFSKLEQERLFFLISRRDTPHRLPRSDSGARLMGRLKARWQMGVAVLSVFKTHEKDVYDKFCINLACSEHKWGMKNDRSRQIVRENGISTIMNDE